ncbi:glycosyltransferase family 39 protein, partial [Aetokthonos hydrillicola]|uniref:glycosyltransferase family 39 protein n=1 Tax=Aetokthonos hydrillicola TaxID=1550245 RepID=UPI001ABB928D
SLGLMLTLGLLLGMLGFSICEKIPTSIERVVWSENAQWIAPQSPNYRFYARHTFDIPGDVQAGWLQLSADNDFKLYVNGQLVARENSALNSSLGLAAGIKIPRSQDFNDNHHYHIQTANYLLASSKDWKLASYVDLTSFLRPGKNVIGLEILKGKTNPRFVLEGAVYPVANAPPIELTTGVKKWVVSNLSEAYQSLQWYNPDFVDVNWSQAKVLHRVTEATYSRLSKSLFERPLQGTWISGTQSAKGQVWLRGRWKIPSADISRAYIRFAGNGDYSLLLNGSLIKHYNVENGNSLHLIEVTKFLYPGDNILAVSLANPINAPLPNGVSFFLDGWTHTDKGEIVSEIKSDRTWSSLTQITPGWTEGAGETQPVTLLNLPQAQQFERSFEGNAYLLNYPNYLLHQGFWQLAGIIFAVGYALILGLWLEPHKSWWDSFNIGTAILSPGTLFLICISLLKHRYGESETGLLFAHSHSNYLILLGFTGSFVLTLLFYLIRSHHHVRKFAQWFLWFVLGLVAYASLKLATQGNIFVIICLAVLAGIIASTIVCFYESKQDTTDLQHKWSIWGEWVFLAFIIGVGFGLRIYNLSFMDLDTDEHTSLDATRGILRTGAPIATSGIWYTRGPFYHYLLAFWLRLVGDSVIHGKYLSAFFGTATLILIYIIARRITGKVWIALLVTAVLAINPWEVWYSRYIRFYQVQQFMSLLSVWTFFKAFIERSRKNNYQPIFFVTLTLTLLTQEISLTLLPAFLLGFLYFYRPFNLLKDWQIVFGSFMTIVIFIYDLGFASIRLLTPLPAISDSTAPYLRLHFTNITEFASNLLVGSDRMQTLYTLLFFVGFVYFIKRQNGKIVFLFSLVFSQILLVSILCYDTAERYGYAIYPIFVLLAIYSAICITESIGAKLQGVLDGLLPIRAIALSIAILLVLGNIEPARTLAAYNESINRRNSQIFEYIQKHKQKGDVVISTLPSLAVTNLGKLDYFLMGTGYFDATYWHEGRLIDRWAGGVVLNNLEQMNRVLEKSKRVWIHIEDTRERRFRGTTWKYIETLGKPIIDSFGTRLRLWQPEDGLPSRISSQGKDLGAF